MRKLSEADVVRANMAKVDKAKVKKSYTQASIERTNQLLQGHDSAERDLEAVKAKIQQKLDHQAVVLRKFDQKEAFTIRRQFIFEEMENNKAEFQRGLPVFFDVIFVFF